MAYPSMFDRLCAHCILEGDCWTWIGSTRRHGGGDRPAVSIRVPGKDQPGKFNAARVMCEIFHGPPPTPLHEASHLCLDNWLCIHPWHIIWETKKENMARRWRHYRDQEANPDHDPDLFTVGLPSVAIPF